MAFKGHHNSSSGTNEEQSWRMLAFRKDAELAKVAKTCSPQSNVHGSWPSSGLDRCDACLSETAHTERSRRLLRPTGGGIICGNTCQRRRGHQGHGGQHHRRAEPIWSRSGMTAPRACGGKRGGLQKLLQQNLCCHHQLPLVFTATYGPGMNPAAFRRSGGGHLVWNWFPPDSEGVLCDGATTSRAVTAPDRHHPLMLLLGRGHFS